MKYNIALFGTFNVENYGDLMFPVIFKKAMEKRGLDFNLFLFSPERTCKKALDENTMVFAADQIDKVHSEHPFHAVVIGGGALIHYNNIAVKFSDSDKVVDYDIGQAWYYGIEFAIRNNIKLIFNLPQIPFPFTDDFKEITRAAFDNCDYISFRDSISKQYLLDIYDNTPPEIDVFPDSVCCISDLISIKELEEIKSSILNLNSKYAVIQFNPQKPESDDEYIIDIIKKFKEQGLEIVLLPIGYTHNDDKVLEEFDKKYSAGCVIINKKLNIIETAAVLAGCEIYFGSSFHGAITAISYGKKAISYNYIHPKNKNNEIFKMYKISEFVVENAKEALKILEQMIQNQISFEPDLKYVLNQLDNYFNNLYSLITDNSKIKPKNYFDFSKPIFKLLPKVSTLERKSNEIYAELETQKTYSSKLENIVAEHLAEAKRCSEYILDLENLRNQSETHIRKIENYSKQLENQNSELTNHFKELEGYVKQFENNSKRLETQSAELKNENSSLNEQLTNVTNKYNSIINSRFWKLTKPIRFCTSKFKSLFKAKKKS